jgi:hypothetical protein
MIKFLWKPKEPEFKTRAPYSIIYNVENFNIWFNDPNNGATYAHSGIFLRTDKLSLSHVSEYLKLCFGIVDGSEKYTLRFLHDIREEWARRAQRR